MNKAELLAQLANEVEAITDVRMIESQAGNVKYYVAVCHVQDGFDVVKQDKIGFFVKNEEAGALGDPILDGEGNPTYEQVPVLDANGDPVLDANGEPTFTDGDQLFVTNPEIAYKEKAVALPKDKNALGMGYLASKAQAGEIYGFKMTESRPDLGPFSFFVVEVALVDKDSNGVPTGTSTTANWRVQMDAQGAPFHVVLV